MVNSVAKRLGSTLIIRIGGSTGDRLLFDPSQAAAAVCASGDCPVGSGATFILGPSYFQGFKSFPNQHFSFQAPLGPTLNLTGSLDYVTRAYQALGADRVDAIALGNEPDDYRNGYTAQDYTTNALKLERGINSALKLPSERIFEVVDLSAGGGGGAFTVYVFFDRAFVRGCASLRSFVEPFADSQIAKMYSATASTATVEPSTLRSTGINFQ